MLCVIRTTQILKGNTRMEQYEYGLQDNWKLSAVTKEREDNVFKWPHGYGEGITGNIRDPFISVLPGQYLRARLFNVWVKLRYPKYSIEEIMNADKNLLNGIMAALLRQNDLTILTQEKFLFSSAGGADAKRKVLVDVFFRLANIPDASGSNLVALEIAIDESTPHGNTRRRSENDYYLEADGIARGLPRANNQNFVADAMDEDFDSDTDDGGRYPETFNSLGMRVFTPSEMPGRLVEHPIHLENVRESLRQYVSLRFGGSNNRGRYDERRESKIFQRWCERLSGLNMEVRIYIEFSRPYKTIRDAMNMNNMMANDITYLDKRETVNFFYDWIRWWVQYVS